MLILTVLKRSSSFCLHETKQNNKDSQTGNSSLITIFMWLGSIVINVVDLQSVSCGWLKAASVPGSDSGQIVHTRENSTADYMALQKFD